MTTTMQVSRRGFLKGGLGALTLAVTGNGLVSAVWAADEPKKYGADSMPGGTVDDPLAFVSIAAAPQGPYPQTVAGFLSEFLSAPLIFGTTTLREIREKAFKISWSE